MYGVITGAHVLAQSKAFVASLDRSVLGSFAASAEALVVADKILRKAKLSAEGVAIEGAYDRIANGMTLGYLNSLVKKTGESIESVNAEVSFWWEVTGYVESSSHRSPLLDKRISHLHLVVQFPTMMRYFEAGLWDVDVIARLMADGIDAELASALFVRNAG